MSVPCLDLVIYFQSFDVKEPVRMAMVMKWGMGVDGGGGGWLE